MKCEQYNKDMTDICEFMTKFVPGHDDSEDWTRKPEKTLSGCDYPAFERHKQAQSSKRKGRTAIKRLGGLLPKMEEFHNKGELLKVKRFHYIHKCTRHCIYPYYTIIYKKRLLLRCIHHILIGFN